LVGAIRGVLHIFGRTLPVDGKAINTHARPRSKQEEPKEADGSGDIDTDFGVKTCHGERKDGALWQKINSRSNCTPGKKGDKGISVSIFSRSARSRLSAATRWQRERETGQPTGMASAAYHAIYACSLYIGRIT